MGNRKTAAAMTAQQGRSAVRTIVRHHFGSAPESVKRETGGLSNLVFTVEHHGEEFVVRLNPDRGSLNRFLKEQWVTERARTAELPVPAILEVGGEPLPYMILRKSAGNPALAHPERMRILRDMGRLAAIINSIPTRGYGATFEWSNNQLSTCGNWSEFLEKEYDLDKRLHTLGRRRILPGKKLDRIRAILRGIGDKRRKPVLNHGDLRLKNVLVDGKGKITAILDWETSTSNLAPEWELSAALHDLSIDEKESFLDGYGLSWKNLAATAPAIKAFNILNYLSAIESDAKERGNGDLDRYRFRLSGALDLYSL
jgi:hygromycin-B 4-O-kinase